MEDTEVETGFAFVIGELVRHGQMTTDEIKSLPALDMFSSVSAHGGGMRVIGRKADLTLRELSDTALAGSPYHRRVDPEAAFSKVKAGFTREYLTSDFKGSTAAEDRARLDAWVEEAAVKRTTLTHLVPCQIGLPPSVSVDIGPVTFRCQEEVLSELQPKFDQLLLTDDDEAASRQAKEVERTQVYLASFQDLARVTVEGCDPKTSRLAAEEAVQAALAYLHLVAGAGYTKRMRGGGPALRGDRRSTIALDQDGHLQLSWSTRWEGAHIGPGFWSQLKSGQGAAMTQAAGVAVRTIVERKTPQLAAARYLDAVAWYADAAKESSRPAAIVKYLTAMERLLWTGETRGVTKRLSERAAALCFSVEEWDFDDLRKQIADAYDLRSGIVHGRISPDDPIIRHSYRICETVARDLMMTWLQRYGEGFETETTVEKAKAHFDGFVQNVKRDAAAREIAGQAE